MIEIIAEIGQNHEGNLEIATELIHKAKENGATVAKFQVFDTDSIFSRKDPWYDYSKKAELTYTKILALATICNKVKIEFMASVFDNKRIHWLEAVKVKRYKIASRSIYNTSLINSIKDTGKPIIASLGMWKEEKFPNFKADFLYCVSEYPALNISLENVKFDDKNYSGFSDHSLGIETSIKAIEKGARIIEKHFTYDKNAYGPDHICSMTFDELKELRRYCDKR